MRRCVIGMLAVVLSATAASAEVNEVKIPKGAGGIGFLPLLVMKQQGLVEKAAREIGLGEIKTQWIIEAYNADAKPFVWTKSEVHQNASKPVSTIDDSGY